MRLLEGKASDILLDYADGLYTLDTDSVGDPVFVDASGEHFILPEEVAFYLTILPEQCFCDEQEDL